MVILTSYTRFGTVEGLGDEEIPWWLAPYVRNFVSLAESSALIDAHKAGAGPVLGSLARRLMQTAAVARVAAHVKGNDAMAEGVSAALAADIDEFCGTPPRPHHLEQAGLLVALIASNLEAGDPAKSALVAQAGRLQKLRGQMAVAA